MEITSLPLTIKVTSFAEFESTKCRSKGKVSMPLQSEVKLQLLTMLVMT